MIIRHFFLGLLAALVLASGWGCKKSESKAQPSTLSPTALSPDSIVRVHWLGKKQLAYEATAYYFMHLWKLPESARLEAQTLDKLSMSPWRLLQGEAAVAQAPTALLRPLLNDLVQRESYFEIRQATNFPAEYVFAIKVDDQRAGTWRTNLVVVFATLTGIETMDVVDGGRGWSLKRKESPLHIELGRVGEWTVVGMTQEKNSLLNEIVGRIKRDGVPFIGPPTNYWLLADVDLAHAKRALSSTIPSSVFDNLHVGLPRASLEITGDGGNVIARGNLKFPQPLQLELEPWIIPTTLLHEPLASFTAVRGFRPWLATQDFWTSLFSGLQPDQAFFWALDTTPLQTYFALPLQEASNQVRHLAHHAFEQWNPWLLAHAYVGFEPVSDGNGLTWGNQPTLLPFLKSVETPAFSMVVGGLLPDFSVDSNSPPRAGVLDDLSSRSNAVFYEWELTGPRVDSWLYLGQLFREVSHHPTLPMDSAGMAWLRALSSRLGPAATVVTRTEADQFTFMRKSTFGLTALELHLLVDWLESPQFPQGTYSLRAPK